MITFQLANLLSKPHGAREEYEIEEPMIFEPEMGMDLAAPVTAEVSIMNMAHEVHVGLEHIKTKVHVQCSRCGKLFELDLEVKEAGRQFILDLPKEAIGEQEDVFYVDKGRNEIDIEPLLREELLLHLPAFPVCYVGCEGISTTSNS